jgi:hypothetical protein
MESIPEVLKLCLRARYSFAIWVTGLATLIAAPSFLFLDQLTTEYGKFVGAITAFSFVVWVVEITLALHQKFQEWRDRKKIAAEMLQSLQTLDPQERQVLKNALKQNRQTVTVIGGSYEFDSLVAKGFLKRTGSEESSYGTIPFLIPNDVWRLMHAKKAELLAEPMPAVQTK